MSRPEPVQSRPPDPASEVGSGPAHRAIEVVWKYCFAQVSSREEDMGMWRAGRICPARSGSGLQDWNLIVLAPRGAA